MSLDLALVISAVDRASRPLQRIGGAVGNLGRNTQRLGRSLKNVGASAVPRLTLPLLLAGGAALTATGQIEQLEVGFEAMTGSAETGATVLGQLINFAATTPFQLTGIGSAARQLLAAGINTTNLTEELRMLGDMASGAVMPIGDMAQIYAKVAMKGKAQTEELNQIAERGIPILDALVELAARHGKIVSKADVYKAAEKGLITFEHLRDAFRIMTSEGGVFFDMMQKQSQTLPGMFSTMKDNIFLALAAVGRQMAEAFEVKENMTRFTAWLGDAVAWFDRLAQEQPGLVKFIFIMTGVAAVLGPALVALGFAAIGIGGVVIAIKAVTGALIALGAAMLANPLGLAVAAVAGLVAVAYLIYRYWDDIATFLGDTWESIKRLGLNFFDWITGIWDEISAPVDGLFSWVGDQWETMTDKFRNSALVRLVAGIWILVGAPVDGLFSWVGDQWETMTDKFRNSALVRLVAGIWILVGAPVDGLFSWVGDQWETMTDKFRNSALVRLVAGIWEQVGKPVEDIFGWAESAFGDLIETVRRLIREFIDTAVPDWVQDLIGISEEGAPDRDERKPAPDELFGPGGPGAGAMMENRFSGTVTVEIKDESGNARLKGVKSDGDGEIAAELDTVFVGAG